MLSKKYYQLFADIISYITDNTNREETIRRTIKILKQDNERFDENKFREWIERKIRGEKTW